MSYSTPEEAAYHGERERGSSGAVFKYEGGITYLLLEEFQPEAFREKLADVLSSNGKESVFVVEEKDSIFHIYSMSRVHVHNTVESANLSPKKK
jgi:hypothetical protein